MKTNLLTVLDGLQERFEGELRGTRAAISHPGSRGDATENDWLNVIQRHIPRRYQAEKAFVIDSNGNCSDQIDIVIYDWQYSPLLYNQSGQRYIPSESVYAVIETKQNIDREYILYAAEKAASVRRLLRTSAPIPYAEGKYAARKPPRIISGIVAYESSWTPAFGEPLISALNTTDIESQMDIGCAIIHGVFETQYNGDGEASIDVCSAKHTLVHFLFRLLKRLQLLATAPAIEYEKYLKAFSD